MREVRITSHAIERWQQRVDPSAIWLSAHLTLRRLLNTGRSRPNPRHWMRRPTDPGTTFVFNARQPGVCVIVTNGAAVTVITRELARVHPLPPRRASRRPRPEPPTLPKFVGDDLAA